MFIPIFQHNGFIMEEKKLQKMIA